MEAHQLEILNDDSETKTGGIHSIIDLTLANKEARPFCLDRRSLKADITIDSDRGVLEWRWSGKVLEVDKSWKINGWALRARLDKREEADKEKEPMVKIEDVWRRKMGFWKR